MNDDDRRACPHTTLTRQPKLTYYRQPIYACDLCDLRFLPHQLTSKAQREAMLEADRHGQQQPNTAT